MATQHIEHAFAQFHEVLVLYARQLLGSRKDAEDVVQDVYIRIMSRQELSFDNPLALKSYALRAVRNMALDRMERKDTLRRTVDIINQEVADEVLPAVDEDTLVEIRRRIEALPSRTRRVIEMVFFEGMKYREAAAALGVSENTVKTFVRLGLNSLRSHFRGREEMLVQSMMLMWAGM